MDRAGTVAQLILDRERREARIAVEAPAVDVKTIEPLEQLIDEVSDAGVDRLELDLAKVSFADSSIVRLAMKAHESLAPTGAKVVIRAAPGVSRLFELTRTAHLFEILPGD